MDEDVDLRIDELLADPANWADPGAVLGTIDHPRCRWATVNEALRDPERVPIRLPEDQPIGDAFRRFLTPVVRMVDRREQPGALVGHSVEPHLAASQRAQRLRMVQQHASKPAPDLSPQVVGPGTGRRGLAPDRYRTAGRVGHVGEESSPGHLAGAPRRW